MLCVCHTTPAQKLFCLHVFRQAGPPLEYIDILDEMDILVYATRKIRHATVISAVPYICAKACNPVAMTFF